MVADELEALEVGDDPGHHECEHALALELTDRRSGCRLELLRLDRVAHRAQLLGETRARPRRVVRDEPQRMNVCVVTGDWTFSALSVALAETVYEPSAGKFAAGKPYVQLDVPEARFQTSLALENALPFQ